MRRNIFFILIVFTVGKAFSQVDGNASFNFLRLSDNARVAALGGEVVSIYDYDVNASNYNPASLNSENQKKLALNNMPFYAGINKSTALYGFKGKSRAGTWAAGASYINYGKIDQTDNLGNVIGTVSSNEYAMFLTRSDKIGPYSLGITAKLAGSNLASYSAFAALFDVGAMFIHPRKDLRVGLAVKNVGFVFKDYTQNSNSTAPLDIQLGMSYKPEHMPLRLYITTHHLQVWDIQYVNEGITTPNLEPEKSKFSEQLFRHFVFGGEFVFSDNFHLRAGYNHMRRKELAIDERGALAGFSFGGMIRLKAIEINYTRAIYHIAGGANVISLTLDTSTFGSKKRTIETEL